MRAALLLATALAAGSAARAAEPAKPRPITADSYAQHLLTDARKAHPQVLAMAMHATPPGGKETLTVASTSGGLGQKTGAEELQVIATGQSKVVVDKSGKRLVVETPLKDVGGDTVGALDVVFPAGGDRQARRAQAEAIRDQLGRRISHAGNLQDRWPYDPHVSHRNYAQALVDRTMAAHPEILILAVHATPPGSKTNIIMGSNIGRIGKAADEDDLRVIEKGSTNKEVNETGKRFEAELPLNDAHGKRIGALGVVFAYHAGEDKEALVARAVKIRDEMAAKIASPAALAKAS